MDCLTILAQTAEISTERVSETQIVPVDYIWEQIATLSCRTYQRHLAQGPILCRYFYGNDSFRHD